MAVSTSSRNWRYHVLDPTADPYRRLMAENAVSTIHATLLEVWGQSEGGGSLEVTTRTLQQMPVADVRVFTDADRDAVVTAYHALVRGDDDAQRQLDRAVLAAIDAEIVAEALRDVQDSLMQDRLPNT